MSKRKILLVLVLVLSASSLAYAALPALLFGEVAGALVESFVIRSVARSVVETVGTAANDASWISRFTAWASASRSIGSIVVSATATATAPAQTYEVQMAGSTSDLTKAPLSSMYYVAWPYQIAGGRMPDGVPYPITNAIELADADPMVAAQNFINYYNTLVKPQALYGQLFSCTPTTGTYVFDCVVDLPGYYTEESLALKAQSLESKDAIRRVRFGSSGWYADTTDPDWTTEDASKVFTSTSLRFNAGTNQVLDLVKTASNNYIIQFQEQVDSSTLRQQSTLLNSAFVPAVYDVSLSSGQLSSAPDGSTATGSSSGASVQFPSDYARQGEALNAANAVAGALSPGIGTIASAVSATTDLTDPVSPDVETLPDYGTTFDDLKGWTLPGHSSACPQPQLDLSDVLGAGAVYTMTAHCGLVNDHFGTLRVAMIAAWTFLSVMIVLRA